MKPVRSVSLSATPAVTLSFDSCGNVRGERVEGELELGERAVEHRGRQRRAGELLDRVVGDRLGLGRVRGGEVDRLLLAAQQRLDRCPGAPAGTRCARSARSSGTARPATASSRRRAPSRRVDQPRAPRLRQPAARELAGLEQVEGAGVVEVLDGDLVRARAVARGCCSLSHFFSATSWVLPSCGVAMILPLSWSGEVMSGEVTSWAPPDVEPGDQPDGLAVGLGERVDRRAGADEPGVERAAEQRRDLVGAGVERLGGELRRAQLLGEEAVGDADERGGVGDVGEVAQPQLGGGGGGGGAGRTGPRRRASSPRGPALRRG